MEKARGAVLSYENRDGCPVDNMETPLFVTDFQGEQHTLGSNGVFALLPNVVLPTEARLCITQSSPSLCSNARRHTLAERGGYASSSGLQSALVPRDGRPCKKAVPE